MKTLPLANLNKNYERACNEYVKKFCNKQGLTFDAWVADDCGGVAVFNDNYYINLSDIIIDINKKAPKGLIIKWQEDTLERHQKDGTSINYSSYIMGLRYEQIEEKFSYEKAAKELWQLLDNIDTLSDICKPTIKDPKAAMAFYKNTLKYAAKRFYILKSDGNNI